MENKELTPEEKAELKNLKGEVYALTRKIGELEVIKSAHMDKLNGVKDTFQTIVNQLIEKYGEDFKIEL